MSTKIRRPVVMATPPPQVRSRSGYSEAEKQSLLDNFDLEVNDKTRAFKANLHATLSSFLIRQETELLRIPRDLKGMTLGNLEKMWGGSWKGTVEGIARGKIEEREREEAAAAAREKAEMEEIKGKRKRAEGSPDRTSKNARHAPGSSKKPLAVSRNTNGVKRTASKTPRYKPSAASSSTQGPNTLPQNHIFNPDLPPTPSFPRQARRNESFFSIRGSPILLHNDEPSQVASSSQSHHSASDSEDHRSDPDSEADDSDELPDAEALEAKILAKSQRSKPSQSSAPSRKNKRAPSLMFRSSIGHGSNQQRTEDGDDVKLASIPLSDGRTVTFDPLRLSPGRVDAEIDEGELDESEKSHIKSQVKEEVFKALQAKLEAWRV